MLKSIFVLLFSILLIARTSTLEWKRGIENSYDYQIIEKKNILTNLGNIDCYIIKAIATSRIGETELVSYFNPEFGFVKLEYKNIDGTKTVLEIEKIE